VRRPPDEGADLLRGKSRARPSVRPGCTGPGEPPMETSAEELPAAPPPGRTMLGVMVRAGEPRCVSGLPVPDPSPGMARLRVILAGICATDLQLLAGYKGDAAADLVLGHEFVAVVDALHPEDSGGAVSVGDRVVSEINCVTPGAPSGSDWRRRAQDPQRTALGIFGSDGCFAEFVRAPVQNLHSVPGAVTDVEAAFVEPLAAACSVLEEVRIRPSDRCAVLGGAGRLGSLITAVLSAAACDVSAVVRDAARAEHVTHVAAGRPVPVASLPPASKDLYDVVVDATGSPLGLQRALQLCRPRGTVVLKSTYAVGDTDQISVDMSLVVVKELSVVGSRCGPFATALRLLERGLVRPGVMVDHTLPLTDAKAAFRLAATPGTRKVLFRAPR
jgi:alcohol dehydrogenase